MICLVPFCFALLFPGAPEGQASPVCTVVEDGVQVYNAALAHLFHGRLSVLVLEDMTRACRDLHGGNSEIYHELRSVWVDYLKANEGSCEINFRLNVSDKQILLSHEAIEAYFFEDSIGGWKRFYTDYSDRSAYARISRIGFGDNRQRAFVYVEYMRGWLAGGGNYLLLEKSQGRWLVAKVWSTWES